MSYHVMISVRIGPLPWHPGTLGGDGEGTALRRPAHASIGHGVSFWCERAEQNTDPVQAPNIACADNTYETLSGRARRTIASIPPRLPALGRRPVKRILDRPGRVLMGPQVCLDRTSSTEASFAGPQPIAPGRHPPPCPASRPLGSKRKRSQATETSRVLA